MDGAAGGAVLDVADLDLIACLQLCPRAGHRLLAETVGVSVPTVSRRLTRLRREGALTFTVQVPWWVHSETHPQHVWITTAAGSAPRVAATVARLPQAQYVAVTTGQADVYAILHSAGRAETGELLTQTLPAIDGVVATHAELALRPFATAAGWRLHRLDAATEARLGDATDGSGVPSTTRCVLRDDEKEVIRLLQADGRSSAADIGRHLGLSNSTAYRLMQSLFDRRIVVPRVEVEPALLGYPIEVVVALVAKPGTMTQLAETLARHISARSVATVAGRSSVMYHGVFAQEAELAEFLSHDVAALPGVTSLDVSIVMQVVTRYWGRREDPLPPPQ